MPFTPDSELDLLFDASLISQESLKALSERNYHIRPLARSDYGRDHFAPLRDLTTTPDIGEKAWTERFDLMKSLSKTYYIVVIVDKATDKIVATGTLFVEYKFIHSAGQIGHIEEIAVCNDQQGKKLGYWLMVAINELSEKLGCYKCILDCLEKNRVFYEKTGHVVKAIQMAKYVQH